MTTRRPLNALPSPRNAGRPERFCVRGLLRLVFVTVPFVTVLSVGCGGSDPKAVAKLTKQLGDSNRHTRNQAALALAAHGEAAASAVPALAQTLRDPNGGVRSSAAYALRSIGTPEATKALDSYQK